MLGFEVFPLEPSVVFDMDVALELLMWQPVHGQLGKVCRLAHLKEVSASAAHIRQHEPGLSAATQAGC